ncbi:MAG: hypothetical protein JNJ88_08475 [Planctomycetes bacterium]|nr:hypothetical protein [Planctomycetota bacterium]
MKETRKKLGSKSGKDATRTPKVRTWGGVELTDDHRPQKPDEMSPEVVEFLKAMDDYRTKHRRPFPSWSEVLSVLLSLGYRKVAAPTPM